MATDGTSESPAPHSDGVNRKLLQHYVNGELNEAEVDIVNYLMANRVGWKKACLEIMDNTPIPKSQFTGGK